MQSDSNTKVKPYAGFKRAIACYGGVEPKVHVSVVPLLTAAINEGKLEIIGMQKRGKKCSGIRAGVLGWPVGGGNAAGNRVSYLVTRQ